MGGGFWEKTADWEIPLDETGLHWKRTITRFRQGMKEFVVIYYFSDGQQRIPLVTYDTAHGFPHRDLRYLDENDKRRKKEIQIEPIGAAFDWSKNDLENNWKRFFEEYRKVRG